MMPFIMYLKDYFRNISVKGLVATMLFVALLVFLNYTWGIEKRIRDLRPWYASMLCFFFFYGFVYFFAWVIQAYWSGTLSGIKKGFLPLLLLAPLFFSAKVIHWDLSPLLRSSWAYPWNKYVLIVLQLPAKLLLLLILLYACRKLENSRQQGSGDAEGNARESFWGLTTKGFSARPYFLILAMLIPLIGLASTQHDFLHVYPKVRNISFISGHTRVLWLWKLLYEISYGLDFVSIELFFRGFLVIGLSRYAGPAVILPMAAFYCTIHFGKPLGECITSFFGGLALGVIAWRSRSILGGLIVHLGMAWIMEIGGTLGSLYF